MPPLPLPPRSQIHAFPFPLHIGTDIVHISRIARLITKRDGLLHTRFQQRIFSAAELEANSERLRGAGLARFLAGRWAVKEAGVKACAWMRVGLRDVVVGKKEGGSIGVWVRVSEGDFVEGRGSLSHDGDYATAVVMFAEPKKKESSGLGAE